MQPVIVPDFSNSYDDGLEPVHDDPNGAGGGVGASGGTPEAPWGINPDTGRPYTKSPQERAEWGEKMRLAREAARASGRSGRGAPRKPAGRPSTRSGRPAAPKAPPLEVTYAQAAAGLLSIPAMGLAVAARIFGSDTLALDSLALSKHIPAIAEAAGQVAVETPAIAAALDKASQIGPWGALAMAVLPLALQIGANHGLVKPSPAMGILTPEELFGTLPDEE